MTRTRVGRLSKRSARRERALWEAVTGIWAELLPASALTWKVEVVPHNGAWMWRIHDDKGHVRMDSGDSNWANPIDALMNAHSEYGRNWRRFLPGLSEAEA